MNAEEVIKLLDLKPLPGEGGWFRETWCSEATVSHPVHGKSRPLGTCILYLLRRGECSKLHRLPGPEVYFFQGGAPLELLILDEVGFEAGRRVVLGPIGHPGAVQQVVVPGGAVQGSKVAEGGAWSLVGTAMAPGFDFADWNRPDTQELAGRYSDWAEWIRQLA